MVKMIFSLLFFLLLGLNSHNNNKQIYKKNLIANSMAFGSNERAINPIYLIIFNILAFL
jgi:hypothetical protein